MTEVTRNSLMFVASLLVGLIIIASGFFLFSNFLDDVTEQRQMDEFLMLAGEISRICQEIKLNPNNAYTGEQFSLIIYKPYKIWYENPTSADVDQVCKKPRCVCFSRINSRVPSDCFSLDDLECPAGKDIKNIGQSGGQQLLNIPPPYLIGGNFEATCKYMAKIEWDKNKLFLNIIEKDAAKEDIALCGAAYYTRAEEDEMLYAP